MTSREDKIEKDSLDFVLGTLWHEEQKFKDGARISLMHGLAGCTLLRISWKDGDDFKAVEQQFPKCQGWTLTGMCRALVASAKERQ